MSGVVSPTDRINPCAFSLRVASSILCKFRKSTSTLGLGSEAFNSGWPYLSEFGIMSFISTMNWLNFSKIKLSEFC